MNPLIEGIRNFRTSPGKFIVPEFKINKCQITSIPAFFITMEIFPV